MIIIKSKRVAVTCPGKIQDLARVRRNSWLLEAGRAGVRVGTPRNSPHSPVSGDTHRCPDHQ